MLGNIHIQSNLMHKQHWAEIDFSRIALMHFLLVDDDYDLCNALCDILYVLQSLQHISAVGVD